MKRLNLLSALALPIVMTAACERTPTGPDALLKRSFVTVPQPTLENVVVCKAYTGALADSFSFEGVNTNLVGSPFKVGKETCRRVGAQSFDSVRVRVTETQVPAGIKLDSVVVLQLTGSTVTHTNLGAVTAGEALMGGSLGGASPVRGGVIVFYNSDLPTPRSFDCTIPTPIREFAVVCKFYNGTLATNFTFEGVNTNLVSNPFTVAANTSRFVASKSFDPVTVSVTEIQIPAGVKLDSVVTYQLTGQTVTHTNLGAVTTGSVEIGGSLGGTIPLRGGIIIFYNSNDGSPPPPPPPPPPLDDEGCTPGFWKNHPAAWAGTGFTTGQTVTSVFSSAAPYPAGAFTLLRALDGGGGTGVNGGAQILARAAVAALLNSASGNVDYPRTTAEVIAAVNAAFASNNRTTMLTLATQLDADNNLGCPL